jgi:protein translocase SecG subunit
VKTALLIVCGVLYGMTALLMLGAVLLQESKGGGLAALGGTRAESAFGASNPLRRMTVVLSVIFFLLASVLSIALSPKRSVTATAPSGKKGAPEIVAPGKKEGVSVTVPITAGDDKDKPDKHEKKGESEPKSDGDAESSGKVKGAEKAGEGEKPAPAPANKPPNE